MFVQVHRRSSARLVRTSAAATKRTSSGASSSRSPSLIPNTLRYSRRSGVSLREEAFREANRLNSILRKQGLDEAVRTLMPPPRDAAQVATEKMTQHVRASVRQNSPVVWNVLLTAMAKQGMFAEAFRLFRQQMRARNITPSAETYGLLIHAAVKNMAMRSPRGLPLEKIKPYGQALRLYQKIPPSKLNRIHINSLMQCCSLSGDWKTLFELYWGMNTVDSPLRREGLHGRGHGPSSNANIVKKNEVKAAELDDQEELLTSGQEVKSQAAQFDSDDAPFDFVKQGKASNKRTIADRAYNSLEFQPSPAAQNIRPDNVTYTILLGACARRGGDDAFVEASSIWDHFKADAADCHLHLIQKRKDYLEAHRTKGIPFLAERKAASKNKALSREVRLREEEYRLWEQQQEDLCKSSEYHFPLISPDVAVVNAILLACSKAEKREYRARAFSIAQEMFPSAFNWRELDRYCDDVAQVRCRTPWFRENNSGDLMVKNAQTLSIDELLEDFPFPSKEAPPSSGDNVELEAVAKLSFAGPFSSLMDSADSCVSSTTLPPTALHPNSRTLAILVTILHALRVPPSFVAHFCDYFTLPTGKNYRVYRTVFPDMHLDHLHISSLIAADRLEDACRMLDMRIKDQMKRIELRLIDPSVFSTIIKACGTRRDASAATRYWKMYSDLMTKRKMDNITHPDCFIEYFRALVVSEKHAKALTCLEKLLNSPHTKWQESLLKKLDSEPSMWHLALNVVEKSAKNKQQLKQLLEEKLDQAEAVSWSKRTNEDLEGLLSMSESADNVNTHAAKR